LTYETILYDERDGIATVTLNRPERLNAYVPQMGEDVVAAFHAARDDADVRVIILTGAGRGFCSGVDLDALKAQQAGKESGPGPKLGEEAFLRSFPLELPEFPKPVIAAINGAAVGVGITMTLPCDVRIAAESAKLGVPFTKLGILPGLGSSYLLSRIVGEARARELVLTSRLVRAPEALEMGLVNKVVPDGQVLEAAREMASQMAACDPDAQAVAKRLFTHGSRGDMAEAMRGEQAGSQALRELRASRQAAPQPGGNRTRRS
jgi:2-(1,2-epoxy-1,2-dihydrophenyl)acetyl-CoA isomerase